MVAKIDFDTLKMYQQMRLKIAKNQKQPPSTQNLFVLIKKRVYYHKERAPGESVLSHARVVNVGLLSLVRCWPREYNAITSYAMHQHHS